MHAGHRFRRATTALATGVSPRYSPRVTGAEVRRIRERLALTPAELARELSVTRITIARWETGV